MVVHTLVLCFRFGYEYTMVVHTLVLCFRFGYKYTMVVHTLVLCFRFGYKYMTIVCECRKYLPYLMNRFTSHGGRVVKRKVQSLEEVCL